MLTSTISAAVEVPDEQHPGEDSSRHEHVRLLGLAGDAEGIVAAVAAIAPTSVCPQCGQPSPRIHSHYVRHVFDLPWHGVAFRLELHVRRFFCDHAACPQRIFTERLPESWPPRPAPRYGWPTCCTRSLVPSAEQREGGCWLVWECPDCGAAVPASAGIRCSG